MLYNSSFQSSSTEVLSDDFWEISDSYSSDAPTPKTSLYKLLFEPSETYRQGYLSVEIMVKSYRQTYQLLTKSVYLYCVCEEIEGLCWQLHDRQLDSIRKIS